MRCQDQTLLSGMQDLVLASILWLRTRFLLFNFKTGIVKTQTSNLFNFISIFQKESVIFAVAFLNLEVKLYIKIKAVLTQIYLFRSIQIFLKNNHYYKCIFHQTCDCNPSLISFLISHITINLLD